MTAVHTKNAKRRSIFLLIGAFPLLLMALAYSDKVIEGVVAALTLCASTIIPTLFPFMILSDLIGGAITAISDDTHTSTNKKKTSIVWLIPFFLGALCGFPLGIRALADLYRRGQISKNEGDRLITFVNNTGPAFVIAGVGRRLFSSAQIGVLLYVVQILSAVLCGILFYRTDTSDPKDALCDFRSSGTPPSFSFLDTVKSCALSALYITALTALFSALASLASVFFINSLLLGFFYSFLEVGGATFYASILSKTAPVTACVLASFAISFGGCAVHMQCFLFLENTPFSKRRYLLAKLTQGLLSVVLFLFLLWLL